MNQVKAGKLLVLCGQKESLVERQIPLLIKSLEFSDFSAGLVHFPKATSKGSELLSEFSNAQTSQQAKAIFRAIDRFEHKTEIESLLKEGKVVITTNYAITNAALSGADIPAVDKIGFFKWVHNLEHEIFKLPKPDLNIILDNEKALDIYKELAKTYPNTKLLPCSIKGIAYTPTEIHNNLWQLVRRILLRNFNPEH